MINVTLQLDTQCRGILPVSDSKPTYRISLVFSAVVWKDEELLLLTSSLMTNKIFSLQSQPKQLENASQRVETENRLLNMEIFLPALI